jgi:hypothetical protein
MTITQKNRLFITSTTLSLKAGGVEIASSTPILFRRIEKFIPYKRISPNFISVISLNKKYFVFYDRNNESLELFSVEFNAGLQLQSAKQFVKELLKKISSFDNMFVCSPPSVTESHFEGKFNE